MIPMRELKLTMRVLGTCVAVAAWCAITTWLGLRALWQFGRVLRRWRLVFGRHLYCPRGHVTSAHGVFECRCGALVEDWVFARCAVCGQTAGWTPCTTCGLPIRNPLL